MLQIYKKKELAYGEMPFEADERQVVYINNGFPHPLNLFVEEKLKDIKQVFAKNGLQFCYISHFRQETETLEEQVRYRVPWLTESDVKKMASLVSVVQFELADAIRMEASMEGKFFLGHDEKVIMKVDISRPDEYMSQFSMIASEYGNKVMRKLGLEEREHLETERLYQELASKKPLGIVRKALEDALRFEEPVISRIIIRRNGDIILPEYNRTVHLRPKEMTLFVFYLRHQDGLPLMSLYDYKQELKHIYSHFALQDDPGKVEATINQLFEDFNDVNVQRSRIKTAFIQKFDESIASNYYITGKKGETMKITLPRELVDWQVRF